MIAIVSPSLPERVAFSALGESQGWITAECDSIRAFRRLLRHVRPRVVLTRRRLGDGYADDVITALAAAEVTTAKILVLMGAGTPSSVEARLVALGADCVQRDPVRTDVLLEYLAKYYKVAKRARRETPSVVLKPLAFAGASVEPVDRQIKLGSKVRHLTPHEVDLVELLVQSEGGILTYETLYHEILGRKFRGETSNMRVLLGKLAASAEGVGIKLRRWVEVIPKLGYRYRPPPQRKRT